MFPSNLSCLHHRLKKTSFTYLKMAEDFPGKSLLPLMTLLQGPTNQTKHDMISPEILKAGVHLHLLEWHDALVVQQNRKAPWKKRRATQRSTSE